MRASDSPLGDCIGADTGAALAQKHKSITLSFSISLYLALFNLKGVASRTVENERHICDVLCCFVVVLFFRFFVVLYCFVLFVSTWSGKGISILVAELATEFAIHDCKCRK